MIFDILTPGWCSLQPALRSARPSRRFCRLTPNWSSAAIRPTNSTPFSALETTAATSAVDRAHAAVGPDTIAKFLFTSGSTGTPKGVINTQRMLCSNQEIVRTMLPFVGG